MSNPISDKHTPLIISQHHHPFLLIFLRNHQHERFHYPVNSLHLSLSSDDVVLFYLKKYNIHNIDWSTLEEHWHFIAWSTKTTDGCGNYFIGYEKDEEQKKLMLILSTRQASADDWSKCNKFCKKHQNCGISWTYLERQWKMHSDKYKHAWYWFIN